MQEQIAQMLDSITCTTLPPDIHKWYTDIISSIKPGEKRSQAADIGVPDASLYYTDKPIGAAPGRDYYLKYVL